MLEGISMLRISSADTIEDGMVADMSSLRIESIAGDDKAVTATGNEDLLAWLYDYASRG